MKPRRFILILTTLLLLTGVIFCFTHLTVPTYKDRTLTSWLRQLDEDEEELAFKWQDYPSLPRLKGRTLS